MLLSCSYAYLSIVKIIIEWIAFRDKYYDIFSNGKVFILFPQLYNQLTEGKKNI